MTKVALTLVAIAALAACDASMTGGPAGPLDDAYDDPALGADPPGTSGENATPWWGVPG